MKKELTTAESAIYGAVAIAYLVFMFLLATWWFWIGLVVLIAVL